MSLRDPLRNRERHQTPSARGLVAKGPGQEPGNGIRDRSTFQIIDEQRPAGPPAKVANRAHDLGIFEMVQNHRCQDDVSRRKTRFGVCAPLEWSQKRLS